MDCIFCKIIKDEIPTLTIYEDELVTVILDIKPSTNGDCLIVPKKHIDDIYDMDTKLLQHILEVERKMYDFLKEKLSCDGLTIVQNNGHGQEIKHFHIHLTPRYQDDQMDHRYNKELLVDLDLVYDQLMS